MMEERLACQRAVVFSRHALGVVANGDEGD
jgi:hypothetical protein